MDMIFRRNSRPQSDMSAFIRSLEVACAEQDWLTDYRMVSMTNCLNACLLIDQITDCPTDWADKDPGIDFKVTA